MDRDGLIRRGGPPCPNGPDRLIGDCHDLEGRRLNPLQRDAKLSLNDRLRIACIAIRQRFPHTENRLKSMSNGRMHFPIRPDVLFSEILPSFRMTDEDKVATKILQHEAGHLAGEGSLFFPVKILRTEQKARRRAERRGHCRQGGKRWGETDFDAAQVWDLMQEFSNECRWRQRRFCSSSSCRQ